MSLENSVVFITGAASGIGFQIAREFARNGAKVVISDIDEKRMSAAVKSLQQLDLDVIGIKCDVASENQVNSAIEQVYETFGKLDVLINNAGLQYIAHVEDFPVEQFERLISVMLIGSFLTIKKVFPLMKKQKYGRIINLASINGLVGFAGKAAYNSAKHGIIGLTKVCALEGAAYNITVNALCPGYVDTPLVRNQLTTLAETRNVEVNEVLEKVIYPLVPIKRLLTVQEITDYALFLASSHSGGITGQAVVIDGGYTAQ